ncbi:MAG: hypothetical protein H6773_03355 [Pseudomonadales bacterium]|nr:hypothetical protein [Pseudomonadales bacterium]
MTETKAPKKTTKKATKKASDKKTEATKPLIAPNTVLTLVVDKKTAAEAYKKTLAKLSKDLKTSGFRKGKVPADVAEKMLGEDRIIQDALELCVPDAYRALIEKEKKQPLTYPEFNPVSLNKGEDWTLEVHIAERPEISLKGYETVAKKALKKAKDELKKQEKELAAHVKEAEKSGEHHDHAHEITDQQRREHKLQVIYKDLIEHIKPEIPELLVKEETRYDLENLSYRLKEMNIKFEDFLKHRGMTFEQLSSELAAGALGRLQATFIISAIAEAAKIKIEQKDVDEVIEQTADKKLQKQQKADPRYQSMLVETLLRQRVADHLLALK